MIWDIQSYEYITNKKNGGVCRTALATPGLLKILKFYNQQIYLRSWLEEVQFVLRGYSDGR